MAGEPLPWGVRDLINELFFSLQSLRSLLLLLNAVVFLFLFPFRVRKRASVMSSEEKVGRDEKQESGRKGSAAPVVKVPAERRLLAIRRVVQDEPNVIREFSLFSGARGDTLFIQTWSPASVKIRGVVFVMHGLNEHSSRYNDFAERLNAEGFKVYAMDWIGHGGSDGLHGYVHSLDYAVADMKLLLQRILSENTGLPCFCFGHSTGGALVLKAALDPEVEDKVAGIILTSPAVGVQPSHPIFVVLAPIISYLFPRFQVSIANKSGKPVSRDPAALVAKYSDPLVYTGPLRVRTGYEILRITTYLQENMSRLKVPFLVLHGLDDTVTDPKASQKLYDEASTDKTIKLFEGLLHDLLIEPERQAIMDDVIQWLNFRV
ncbi:Alpha/beta-Hydrolases superfamily protein isoform 3 [Hibiscus syriacus]|uniref:Alpha/beta-Hydrolases superfamily protein isoform 3 n=1 Tax=Hibiscus syriacus TaxID=106335 RepID=A0A6A2Y578_HIBSY|nr:monoacylglycerol lipase-like [Hibiscus syriacus]KAE8663944.1 Alpha/beta-Hydrolases superfamily protein isoform 3 [Hibiscus syriacus]